MLANRTFTITDEGDEIHLAIFQNGEQVGGGLFPDDGTGTAFDMAYEVGEQFVGYRKWEQPSHKGRP
jgi:hypothetical protein